MSNRPTVTAQRHRARKAKNTMAKAKPCAACGHPKSSHRVGYCIRSHITRGQTFMGVGTVVKYCQCDGYVIPAPAKEKP